MKSKSPKKNKKSLRRSRSKKVKKSLKNSTKACAKSTNSKYLKRPGPPYPAQDCKKLVRMGNDTLFYASRKDKNGIYRWKKIDKKWNVPDGL